MCGLFAGLPAKELKEIERGMKTITHSAGKEMMVTGQKGIGFMIILEGDAEVSLPSGRKHRLRPGDHFGEMALLDDKGRSATVTAVTEVSAVAVPQWSFKAFLAEHPEVAWRLMQNLSHRLREAQAS